jgi:hypothetical protein
MNQFETVQDLIAHLSSLPTEVKNGPVLTSKGVSDSEEFTSLSGTSFMYVDKEFKSGYTDEVWDEEDLLDSAEDSDEEKEILAKFRKTLVLWFE